MSDLAWIEAALTAARPQVLGALLRYFRDLDIAEEAFQDACLRALRNWPQNGPPREPAAWLIMVGRNVAIDQVRRRNKQEALPPEEVISDLDDAEAELVERLDGEHYRDDILRLLFICCHPDLPATQQIALALRIVSGMSVKQIARAFLVSESAMEQRITRAKGRVARADVPFETPGAVERAERLAAVAAMIYLIFNEGYSASGAADTRAPLAEEAIRLARLLLRLFPGEPEIMGLLALLLVQHARAPARFDADGSIVLLEDQDRSLWNRTMIAEGLALIDKAMRHRRRGPLPGAGRDRGATCAGRPPAGHRLGADRSALCRARDLAAVAGGHAEPGGCRRQGPRSGRGVGDDRAVGPTAVRLFPLFRREGRVAHAARSRRGGPGCLRPGHRAGQYRRGGRPHQDASRPAHEGRRTSRRRPGIQVTPKNLCRAVEPPPTRSSSRYAGPDNNTTQERTMLETIVIIAIVVVVLLAAVLIYAATKPDTFRVARSIGIKAPPEKIFALVDDLHSHRAWSPWEQKDPAMKRSYSGAARGKGAVYEWEGNKNIGKGRMEITETSPLSRVVFKLDFIKPFEAHNIGELVLEPKGDTTNVTWAIYGPSPYMTKVMSLLCNMDKMIGKEFDTGLANLKTLTEK